MASQGTSTVPIVSAHFRSLLVIPLSPPNGSRTIKHSRQIVLRVTHQVEHTLLCEKNCTVIVFSV